MVTTTITTTITTIGSGHVQLTREPRRALVEVERISRTDGLTGVARYGGEEFVVLLPAHGKDATPVSENPTTTPCA